MDVMLIAEDQLSEAVLRRLVAETKRLAVYQALPMGGAGSIRKQLDRFRNASNVTPHVILVDLDRYACAPRLLEDWNFNPLSHPRVLFRVAVREIEAWLLADRKGIAQFLQVAENKIPERSEQLPDPKRALINLARNSRSKRFAADMVPAIGSSAQIGPFYNTYLSGFVREAWDIEAASERAPSLAKAIARLTAFSTD